MNPKFRRIIVWVLLLSLILSLVPAVVLTAFAENAHNGEHALFAGTVVSDDSIECERHCPMDDCNYSGVQDYTYTNPQPVEGGNG